MDGTLHHFEYTPRHTFLRIMQNSDHSSAPLCPLQGEVHIPVSQHLVQQNGLGFRVEDFLGAVCFLLYYVRQTKPKTSKFAPPKAPRWH